MQTKTYISVGLKITSRFQDYLANLDEGFAILGIEGEGLPTPYNIGMSPTIMHAPAAGMLLFLFKWKRRDFSWMNR